MHKTESISGNAPVCIVSGPRISAAVSKRAFDIVGAVLLLICFAPTFFILGLCVALSSRGPIIYSQARVGREGRIFRFYKFRSMVVDADAVLRKHLDSDPGAAAQWDAYQKLDKDPRITPIGRFIRRSSLDELPQLWNVLRGDMSLVGPRPCMPAQVELYGSAWISYCLARPGLTGLWQVSGRNQLTFAERVMLDEHYVLNWSYGMDLAILIRTVKVVLYGVGSK